MIKYVAFRFIEINDMKESERVYFIFEDSSRAVGFIIVLYLYFQKLKVYGSFWINKWNKVSFDENVVIKETTVG